MTWHQSMSGWLAALRRMAEDLKQRAESGEELDEDWLTEHQPDLRVYLFEQLLRHLAEVREDPAKLDLFFKYYVDLPSRANGEVTHE